MGLALVAVILPAVASAAGALAASPSSAPAPSIAGPEGVEAWVDADFITPDAPPGGVLEAGITFWNAPGHALARVGGVTVLLRPAKGDAKPSVGTVQADFPGHVVVDLVVPEGGPGSIEVGVPAQVCKADGTCSETLLPIPIAGTGPPPEADAADLIDATLHPLVGDIVAGREFPITVDVVGKGQWVLDTLPLPDHLIAVVAEVGGADVATAELRPGVQPGSPYTGRLTIPETGQLSLTVAIPATNGEDQVLPGATTALKVIGGGRPPSAEPTAPEPPAAPSGEIPMVVWLGGIGAVLVAGVV